MRRWSQALLRIGFSEIACKIHLLVHLYFACLYDNAILIIKNDKTLEMFKKPNYAEILFTFLRVIEISQNRFPSFNTLRMSGALAQMVGLCISKTITCRLITNMSPVV